MAAGFLGAVVVVAVVVVVVVVVVVGDVGDNDDNKDNEDLPKEYTGDVTRKVDNVRRYRQSCANKEAEVEEVLMVVGGTTTNRNDCPSSLVLRRGCTQYVSRRFQKAEGKHMSQVVWVTLVKITPIYLGNI